MTPDANAMRTAAARLRAGADRLRVHAATIAGNVGAMAYAGPAANRFRAATDDRVTALQSAAAQLDDGASRLLGAAVEVELEQSAGGW
jgi:hypothetical protein